MTKPQQVVAAPESTSSAKDPSKKLARWSKLRGVALGALFLLAIGALILWLMATALIASNGRNADPSRFWAAFTGPVGDTLGPILSTMAILVTVFVAVWWQPRQNRLEWTEKYNTDRADLAKEQEDARTKGENAAAVDRASKVDGWIAESSDGRRTGVVVENASDAVVFDLDLVVLRRDIEPTSEVGVDREFRLPRGVWFVEFAHRHDGALSWRAPVPVRGSDGMTVVLNPLGEMTPDLSADEVDQAPAEYVLRPHVPQVIEGKVRPYFVLQMRYGLHDQDWTRDEHGRPVKADPLSAEVEYRRVTAGNLVRQEQRNRAVSSRRVNSDLEALLRYTIEVLCRSQYPDVADLYEYAMHEDLKVDPEVLPGASYLKRPGNGGTLVVGLNSPAGATLVLAQSGSSFPQRVELMGREAGAKYYIGDKSADGVIAASGARVIGKNRATDIRGRAIAQWVGSEADRWKWINVMRAMVSEAKGASLARTRT